MHPQGTRIEDNDEAEPLGETPLTLNLARPTEGDLREGTAEVDEEGWR